MLDSDVQICIIDLAAEWVDSLELPEKTPEQIIKFRAERFDQAYQDIMKTILSSGLAESSSGKGKARFK
ncbi:hypothetical protein ACFLW5_02480 [Chloroflexota bacterium]